MSLGLIATGTLGSFLAGQATTLGALPVWRDAGARVRAVKEPPVANNVTSTPLATSPSVSREANCSHGP